MSARTPREAIDAFVDPLKEIVGCITDEGFITRYSRRDIEQRTATFQDQFAIVNQRNGQALRLEVFHRFIVTRAENERGSWSARTVEYVYEVADSRDEPIAAFHWHPENSGRVTRPHVHVHGNHDTVDLHKLHLPTGRVSLEAIVRFLIEDLDVIPRRPDWDAIVERHETRR